MRYINIQHVKIDQEDLDIQTIAIEVELSCAAVNSYPDFSQKNDKIS